MRRVSFVLGLACLSAVGCDQGGPTGEWVAVAREDLHIEVEVTGTLKAMDSDAINPPSINDMWEFQISMMAPEGAEVKKGEPILAFDMTEVRRRLERKQADRDTAATQVEASRAHARVSRFDDELALAEAQAEKRKAELASDAPEGVVAVVEAKKAKMDVELARARVEHLESKSRDARLRSQGDVERWESQRKRAEVSVQSLAQALESMTIKAPRDGTVVYETNWRGEKKKVGDSVWRVETVLQVVSLDAMQGVGEVDEVDSSQVRPGQSVALHLDAQPDVVLRGTIESVSTMVRRQSPENPLKVAELKIALEPNEKLRLRPGMRFRGRVLTDKAEQVLVAPLDAILPTPEGPKARVRRGSGTELVPVQVGRRNATTVEIVDGLQEGDQLLQGGGR